MAFRETPCVAPGYESGPTAFHIQGSTAMHTPTPWRAILFDIVPIAPHYFQSPTCTIFSRLGSSTPLPPLIALRQGSPSLCIWTILFSGIIYYCLLNFLLAIIVEAYMQVRPRVCARFAIPLHPTTLRGRLRSGPMPGGRMQHVGRTSPAPFGCSSALDSQGPLCQISVMVVEWKEVERHRARAAETIGKPLRQSEGGGGAMPPGGGPISFSYLLNSETRSNLQVRWVKLSVGHWRTAAHPLLCIDLWPTHRHLHVPCSVTERYLWSYRPLTSPFSFCALYCLPPVHT